MGVVWMKQRVVVSRKCPNINCGFEVSQMEVEGIGLNLKCPKSQRYTLSQFIPNRYEDNGKNGQGQ